MRKLKRLFLSIPTALALVLVGLCISAFGLYRDQAKQPNVSHLTLWAAIGLLLAIIFLVIQTWAEYTHKTYDPTWILKYQDMWDDSRLLRSEAAKVLSKNKDKLAKIDEYESLLSPIDDALDILEDIGFYVKGNQISPEVAHHHFYHWIRGYWCASQEYVKAWRRKESARWQHLSKLYKETSDIECSIEGCTEDKLWLKDSELAEFLKQEADHEEGS